MSALHVETQGSGPTLVLLHGWGLNVRVWDGVIAALGDDVQTVAVDLPGHGKSPWDDRARTLDGMTQIVSEALSPISKNTNVTLLGWSLGGQLALQLAASNPSFAQRLVLVATTPKFEASADWSPGMKPEILAGFARQLGTDYRQTVSDFLELQVRGSANADEALRLLRSAVFEHGEATHEALTTGLASLASTDLRPLLSGVNQSALVVSGQYDRVTPSAASRTMAAALPHATFLEIRRAGHAPFLSHTTEFTDALRSFYGA